MPYIHTTSLIKKDYFPGFDENIKRFQDWDLWLTMLQSGHTGYFINQILNFFEKIPHPEGNQNVTTGLFEVLT